METAEINAPGFSKSQGVKIYEQPKPILEKYGERIKTNKKNY